MKWVKGGSTSQSVNSGPADVTNPNGGMSSGLTVNLSATSGGSLIGNCTATVPCQLKAGFALSGTLSNSGSADSTGDARTYNYFFRGVERGPGTSVGTSGGGAGMVTTAGAGTASTSGTTTWTSTGDAVGSTVIVLGIVDKNGNAGYERKIHIKIIP